MSDRTKIMVAGVSQVLAARIAAELNADLAVIGIESRPDQTGFDFDFADEPCTQGPVYRSKPWVQTHPTSPKRSKNSPMKKGKRK